ncbi:MAG: hypothetical protein DCC64_12000 [Planctomycetota bacterium]|nr:MAG: hypothetical protein DCC64_12000 [Planctomycetota bacterium]
MCKFFKTIFIVGLVGLGTLGVAVAVLGKHRARDAVRSLQKMAQSEVDELIRRQNDMKEQLAALRDQYPKQVAALRAQQAEVDQQVKQLEKEAQRCTDIIALCDEDISTLTRQRKAAAQSQAGTAAISFRGGRYSLTEAETLTVRIHSTREMYARRLAEIGTEREVLASEKAQLASELELVTAEQQEFEAEYQSLVREIDRLKRNQELIELAERRTGQGYCRHGESMETLSKVRSALDKARTEQEERMKSARIAPRQNDYETRARLLEIERRREATRKVEGAPEQPMPAADDKPAEEEEPELEAAMWGK